LGSPVPYRAAPPLNRETTLTLKQAAERVGVSPSTLRRWAESGVVPNVNGSGDWTPAAVSHARIVARMRGRGHRLEHIRRASQQGRLATGLIEGLFADEQPPRTLKEVAELTDLEPALIERFWVGIGLPTAGLEHMSEDDTRVVEYVASVLAAGFPLVAFLQLCRVYGQALSQIADAEVRLFHIYVHEPLMREGVPGLEMAEEMEGLARDLLPLSSPLMDYVHRRFLQHFVEQDVVGHMEMDLEDEDGDLGRVRVVIAFVDLAGYTRFTEEEGEEQALGVVERFVEGVTNTLPDGARVVKTIGDEVMVVGQDVHAVVDWAVGFATMFDERPEPRIGIHYGRTLYRDGDYFGREVNLASRVVARARGGEVLVSDSVLEAVGDSTHLRFEPIGQVKLKGFGEPVQLCRASPKDR
ncbi:MAG TPA: adenylate/guanylate cyclase domain-containing protein, partial [Thermoleophilaceae bacterium]|nr:adenylate/guanylate cyclase domain-containing protein [Thermoleophilaceae bacterium]